MQLVKTADGSETFHNETYNEAYHSYTGAVDEALRKFCEPTKISELAKQGPIRLLDVCFGMGYNSAMAIDVALATNPNCKIEIIGLENDSAIVEKIQEVQPEIKSFSFYRKLDPKNLSFTKGNISVTLLLGDAKKEVKKLENDFFDVVFFDPFSPKTQPEMWSADFFKEMYRVMKKDAVLATYSCARVVRDNMKEAGLAYEDGPKVGRRGPGTLAYKQ